jgi:hypothetical protein
MVFSSFHLWAETLRRPAFCKPDAKRKMLREKPYSGVRAKVKQTWLTGFADSRKDWLTVGILRVKSSGSL